ncbi:hypothetical protein KUV85_05005 [Nocardioides panacisoli]|uniref:hypothetical protein n=1 Tax=Nocardioides panacisoli TaxID=627624 RepID=UPI001C633EFC|nr:hypothetical protein [Nocardioides panacisoli]QYJ05047.1 hypothetical protein KUV85_05005 [Nocardioides panacisoli]
MFWLYVGVCFAVVLLAVWLYDLRRRSRVDGTRMREAMARGHARRAAEPGHQQPGTPPGATGGF